MKKPRHLDLFSGGGGFTIGMEAAGFETVAFSEVDPFANRVLEYRWPHIPNLGDITEITNDQVRALGDVDVVTFGSPCQDFSVAGKRLGIEGERSGLFHEAIRVIRALRSRPRFVVFENVPGIFSSGERRDFAAVLDEMAESGALDISWRVLDAQWYGVPQRRRRVFLVADFGGERAGEILSIGGGVFRTPPPRREEEEEDSPRVRDGVAGTLNGRRVQRSHTELDGHGAYIPEQLPIGFYSNSGYKDDPVVGLSAPLKGTHPNAGKAAVAFAENQRAELRLSEVHPQLSVGGGKPGQGYPAILWGWVVRRLTPLECERLMGWPEVRKTVTIRVCSDQQKSLANAENPSLKSQRPVGNAERTESSENASSAGESSPQSAPVTSERAEVSVVISSEGAVTLSVTQQKSPLLASSAEERSAFDLPEGIDSFVRLAALTTSIQELITLRGRAGSPTKTEPSSAQGNGNSIVELSGQEIDELADGAVSAIETATRVITSTTSAVGPSSHTLDSILKILCSSVLRAIAGYIPAPILSASSYDLKLSLSRGWTDIPGAKDAGRYSLCGNGVASPVVKWLGRRIKEAL